MAEKQNNKNNMHYIPINSENCSFLFSTYPYDIVEKKNNKNNVYYTHIFLPIKISIPFPDHREGDAAIMLLLNGQRTLICLV